VVTIHIFGKLNVSSLFNQGENGKFNQGSFYFRQERWSVAEMADIMFDIAKKSIFYYFAKYGESSFKEG
jgi:type II restriction enzyme